MNELTRVKARLDPTTARFAVRAVAHGVAARATLDDIAVEAPLEVRFEGEPVTVMMRTPGHDEELVLGFLLSEGLIESADEVAEFTRPAGSHESEPGSVIDIRFAGGFRPVAPDRMFASSASCGACGKRDIQSLGIRGQRVESGLAVSSTVLSGLPDRLRKAQPTFALTGGVHASGLFTREGELVALREDVGRHNALDKLIGWALSHGHVPLNENVVLLSGRVSYELVQKAVMASIPVIAAVGAPSSMAIEVAREYNVTLVGFLRAGGMNIYVDCGRIGC